MRPHKVNKVKVNGEKQTLCEDCAFTSKLQNMDEVNLAHEQFVAQQAFVDAGYKWGKEFMESYPIFKGELTFPSQTKNDDLWFSGARRAIEELARSVESSWDSAISTVTVRWWN